MNSNPLLNIVDVDDVGKNPTADELALACVRQTTVNFAYEMNPEKAEQIGEKAKGLMPLRIDSFHVSAGAIIFSSLRIREGKQPVKVTGIYTAPIPKTEKHPRSPASGRLEMHVR